MPSTRPTPLSSTAPTPANTPRVTPLPTPGTSPQRTTGAIPKQQQQQQQQVEKQQLPPKPQREKEPVLLLIARSEVTLPQMNHQQIKKELNREKILKFVYTNATFTPDQVKQMIKNDKYDLTKLRLLYLVQEHFNQLKSGGPYKMASLERLVRR